MASDPITLWQIDGENVETVSDYQISFYWAPKSMQMVTAYTKLKDACTLEEQCVKPRQCFKKQRLFRQWSRQSELWFSQLLCMNVRIGLQRRLRRQRIDAFKLWCWRRLLKIPWTARRSNSQSLKEISPEYPLEELILKLQYFGHLMRRADSLEKTLILGKTEGKRRREQQRMRWLGGITDSMDMSLSELREIVMGQRSPVCCSSWGLKELYITQWLNNNNNQQC